MASKLGFARSLFLDISVGIKAPNKINNVVSSLKSMDKLSVSIGVFHQCRNSCIIVKRTANSPAAAYKTQSGVSEESPDESGSPVQSQLDLLERLTSKNTVNLEGSWQRQVLSKKTIREKLSELASNDIDETLVPLGKRFKPNNFNSLTISQKRNIKRQDYLNTVAKRNDIPFFTTIALFVILPPILILIVAVATGYVDLFP